ncbi:hypothetical protein ACFPRL_21000 [Pseudoclavibacter helvolus]
MASAVTPQPSTHHREQRTQDTSSPRAGRTPRAGSGTSLRRANRIRLVTSELWAARRRRTTARSRPERT